VNQLHWILTTLIMEFCRILSITLGVELWTG